MSDLKFTTLAYEGQRLQVSWDGVSMEDGEDFNAFMSNDVSYRLYDEEEVEKLKKLTQELENDEFDAESIEIDLNGQREEKPGWAVGEAIAEVYLENAHGLIWPWNMERDKRNPQSSLPGADLVGFSVSDREVRFVLGEVKSSSEKRHPPQIMSSRSGHMGHQLNQLASDRSVVHQILIWLYPRCRDTVHEEKFKKAYRLYLKSGKRAVSLFGVLIRDTQPNILDVQKTAQALAETISKPATCHLIVIYLPCAISDLPHRISGE